ncbi:unnamed protein product, partial [marine sediment metagenome]
MRRKKKERGTSVIPYELAEKFCGLFGEDLYKGTRPKIKRPAEGDILVFEDLKASVSLDRYGGVIKITAKNYTYIPAPENETEERGMFRG